ncbi:hypothetical protein E2C01_067837 [Portunus trituberculatus]|uniref:Uncharacterized protein n=1 Tax=Portunus trituberculatus TaxID=210409 RepID=A0A5B7HUW9_PORTR|nr:hypothetical protein [Portunus trituberculatus]
MGQKCFKSESGGGSEARPATRLASQRAGLGSAGAVAVLGPVAGLAGTEN